MNLQNNAFRIESTNYEDMFGDFSTGIAGANQWLVANIRDTLFPIQWLRNNSTDFFCIKTQSPHWRKRGVAVKPVHIHYVLDQNYTANQTIVFDVYYTWVTPGTLIPNLANWTQVLLNSIVLSTGNLLQWYNDIISITPDLIIPSPDNYGNGLLIRIVRGNGTYTGNLGIMWADNHALRDRLGSINEATD